MKYELIFTYNDGTMKKEQAELPAILAAVSIYMEDNSWLYCEIRNCETDEMIAVWGRGKKGVTCL